MSDPSAADAAADAPADARLEGGGRHEGGEYDQLGEHVFDLPQLTESSREDRFDLTVVGCGPAGLSAADRASSKGLRVALVDPKPLAIWRNNYGVWVDEFEELGLADCFNNVWNRARVVIDDEHPDGILLDRPYAQVNRKALKDKLLQRCIDQGVVFGSCAVESVDHEKGGSVIALKGGADGAAKGQTVHSKMVLDATAGLHTLNAVAPAHETACLSTLARVMRYAGFKVCFQHSTRTATPRGTHGNWWTLSATSPPGIKPRLVSCARRRSPTVSRWTRCSSWTGATATCRPTTRR